RPIRMIFSTDGLLRLRSARPQSGTIDAVWRPSTPTFGAVFHARLQVDPARPNVHVTPPREVALLPSIVFGLPLRRQPRDHGGRQVRRILAQEGSEGLLEVAGRHPAQIENRQQRVETLRSPRPLWQDRPTR